MDKKYYSIQPELLKLPSQDYPQDEMPLGDPRAEKAKRIKKEEREARERLKYFEATGIVVPGPEVEAHYGSTTKWNTFLGNYAGDYK